MGLTTRGRFEKGRGKVQYILVLQQDGGLKKEEGAGITFEFYSKREVWERKRGRAVLLGFTARRRFE